MGISSSVWIRQRRNGDETTEVNGTGGETVLSVISVVRNLLPRDPCLLSVVDALREYDLVVRGKNCRDLPRTGDFVETPL
jgi:hypothetical protein